MIQPDKDSVVLPPKQDALEPDPQSVVLPTQNQDNKTLYPNEWRMLGEKLGIMSPQPDLAQPVQTSKHAVDTSLRGVPSVEEQALQYPAISPEIAAVGIVRAISGAGMVGMSKVAPSAAKSLAPDLAKTASTRLGRFGAGVGNAVMGRTKVPLTLADAGARNMKTGMAFFQDSVIGDFAAQAALDFVDTFISPEWAAENPKTAGGIRIAAAMIAGAYGGNKANQAFMREIQSPENLSMATQMGRAGRSEDEIADAIYANVTGQKPKPVVTDLPKTKQDALNIIFQKGAADDWRSLTTDEFYAKYPMMTPGKEFSMSGGIGGTLSGGLVGMGADYLDDQELNSPEMWLAGGVVGAYLGAKYGGGKGAKSFVASKDTEPGAMSDVFDRKTRKWIPDTGAKIKDVIGPDDPVRAKKVIMEKFGESAWKRFLKYQNKPISIFADDPETAAQKAFYKEIGYSATPKLDDVLDHPALFEAEPQLRDVKFQIDPGYGPRKMSGREANFNSYENLLTVSSDFPNLSEQDKLSTILHEVQHSIQDEHKWAMGGSPFEIDIEDLGEFARRNYPHDDQIAQWTDYVAKIKKKIERGYPLSPSEADTFRGLEQEINNWAQRNLDPSIGRGRYKLYRAFGGEQESRATEAALKHPDMDPWSALRAEEGDVPAPITRQWARESEPWNKAIRESTQQAPEQADDLTNGFYSQAKRVLKESGDQKFAKDQIINFLKKRGVKDEEIKWAGIGKFVDNMDDGSTATAKQISDAMEQPQITQKTMSEIGDMAWKNTDGDDWTHSTGVKIIKTVDNGPGYQGWQIQEPDGKISDEMFNTPEAGMQAVDNMINEGYMDSYSRIKYKGYSTPEGWNYRETLDTLDSRTQKEISLHNKYRQEYDDLMAKRKPIQDQINSLNDQADKLRAKMYYDDGEWHFHPSDKKAMDRINEQLVPLRDKVFPFNEKIRDLERKFSFDYPGRSKEMYSSPHWEDDNVLYHVRKQDLRVGGKNALLVDEIQSDWHQQGRKQGYAPASNSPEVMAAKKRLDDFDSTIIPDLQQKMDDLQKPIRKLVSGKSNPELKSAYEVAEDFMNYYKNPELIDGEIDYLKNKRAAVKELPKIAKRMDEIESIAERKYLLKRKLYQDDFGFVDKLGFEDPELAQEYYSLSRSLRELPDKTMLKAIDSNLEWYEASKKMIKDNGDMIKKAVDAKEELWQAKRDRQAALEIADPKYAGKVPDAPYSKTWNEKAMKDVINEAIDNGYDKVAWTTGKAQSDRYSLAKQIDRLDIGYSEDGYKLYGMVGMERKEIARNVPEEKLADYVGKDVAKRIVEVVQKEDDPNKWFLDGLDLEVGGEGMKGFYDEMLPKFVKKYLKKYGVEPKLEPIGDAAELKPIVDKINGGADPLTLTQKEQAAIQRIAGASDFEGAATLMNEKPRSEYWKGALNRLYDDVSKKKSVWTFDITDEMRRDIGSKGQPLYNLTKAPQGDTTAFNAPKAAPDAATMASESLPSTGTLPGRIIKRMSLDQQAAYHDGIQKLMSEADGTDFAIKQAGLKQIDTVHAPSEYQGHIGVGEQTRIAYEVGPDGRVTPEFKNKLRLAAAIKGYVQDQDAVALRHFIPATADDFDSLSIDMGRVIKDNEMRAIESALVDAGYSMDDVAMVSSKYGVDLLNVSFGGIDQKRFSHILDIIDDVIDGDVYMYKNDLLEDGYVGGFDGYKSGQKAYKEVLNGASDKRFNIADSGEAQRWGIDHDLIVQKRNEVREFTDKFINEHKLPRKSIREIGEESDAAIAAAGKQLDINDHSFRARKQIRDSMVDEVDSILKGGDRDARGWYTARYQTALDELAAGQFPELKNKESRDAFTAILAITSNSEDVTANMKLAVKDYQEYLKTGRFDQIIHNGQRTSAANKNFSILQKLVDDKGLEGAVDWLNEYDTVGNIRKMSGEKMTGWFKDTRVPRSTIFGNKLGMFFSNLSGHPNNLTMDRWWTRSFNRYRGQMSTLTASDSQYDILRKALGRPKISKSALDDQAEQIIKAYNKRSKELTGNQWDLPRSEVEQAANNIFSTNSGLRDTPMNAADRRFMQRVAAEAVVDLKKKGYSDLTVSDMQAILWYGEKRRMREFGSRAPIRDIDYADAVNILSSNHPEDMAEVGADYLKSHIPGADEKGVMQMHGGGAWLTKKTEEGSDAVIRSIAKLGWKAVNKITGGALDNAIAKMKESDFVDLVTGHKIRLKDDYMDIRDKTLMGTNRTAMRMEMMHHELAQLPSQTREGLQRYLEGEPVKLSKSMQRLGDYMIEQIDEASKQLVKDGLLSQDTYDNWKGMYVHRTYAPKLSQRVKNTFWGKSGFTIDEIKRRGKVWTGDADEYALYDSTGILGKPGEGFIEAKELPNGNFEFRRDWTSAERDAMGEIRDVAYTYPETMMRISTMAEHSKLLKSIPEKYLVPKNTKLTELALEENGYKLLTGEKYGVLNGRWVSADIANDINNLSNMMVGGVTNGPFKEFRQFWNDYVRSLKKSHTVFNPRAHFNNWHGNIAMIYMSGLDPVKAYKDAIKGVAIKGDFDKLIELRAKDIVGTISGTEATELRRLEASKDLLLWEDAAELGLFGRSKLNDTLNQYMTPQTTRIDGTMEKISGKFQKLYQAEDDAMRFASLKQLTEGGMSIEDAVKKINNDIIPDYTKPMSRAGEWMRRTGTVPFIAWTYYSTPMLIKQVRDHPTRALALMGSLWALNYFQGIEDGEDMPYHGYGMEGKAAAVPGLSSGDEKTMVRYSNTIPHMQLTEPGETLRGLVTGGIPQQMMFAAPWLTGDSAINPYFMRPVTYRKDGKGVYDNVKYGVQNFLPTPDIADSAYNLIESLIMTPETRRTNPVINPKTPTQEILGIIPGINVRTYSKSRAQKKNMEDEVKELRKKAK